MVRVRSLGIIGRCQAASACSFQRVARVHGDAPGRERGRPGEQAIDYGAIDMKEGGTAIPYYEEDPFLRKEYEETLKREGIVSRMDDSLYRPPAS